jgi:hypothetical protein
MLDALLKKSFNLRVLEVCSIVASNFELVLINSLRFIGYVIFPAKEHPSEARIVIHNYKTILTPTDAYVSNRVE